MQEGGLSILIVEDMPDNLSLASVVFRRAGFQVNAVTTGQAALDFLRSERVDVVALDLRLPDMSGFEVASRLKADPELRDIPVVAVTALAMKGDRERALQAGCDDYITKPVDTRTLAEQMQRIVREHRARRS